MIHVPDLRVFSSRIWHRGLAFRPTSLCSLAGQNDSPMLELTISPQSGTMNFATADASHLIIHGSYFF
jgi:hypothetical protein